MNIAKVKNSAAIVNYVKPELEMVEMEVEGSILADSGPTSASISINQQVGKTYTEQAARQASRR